MAKGIVRKLDELGRITLPIEIRRSLNICAGDRLGISLDGRTIRISKTVAGMSRPVDELGRVVIPKEIRRSMKFIDNQPVDTWIEGNEICLTKYGKVCAICGRTGELFELHPIKEAHICNNCVTAVKGMEG